MILEQPNTPKTTVRIVPTLTNGAGRGRSYVAHGWVQVTLPYLSFLDCSANKFGTAAAPSAAR